MRPQRADPRVPRLTDEAGVTLIEAIIAVLLTGIVVAGAVTALILGYHSQTASIARTSESAQAEIGLERLLTDVRNAAPSCSSQNGLSGGLTVSVTASATEVEMCDPAPGAAITSTSTTNIPATNVIAWNCVESQTTDTCGRYVATTATAIASAISGAAAAQTTINGVQSVTLTGILESSSDVATGTQALTSGTYPLVPSGTASGISWLGVTLRLLQLAHPGNAGTVTVPSTSTIPLSSGTALRNFTA